MFCPQTWTGAMGNYPPAIKHSNGKSPIYVWLANKKNIHWISGSSSWPWLPEDMSSIVHCQVWNILENTSSSIPLFCSIYPHVWWDVCWFYHHMSLHCLCGLNTLICLRKQHVFVGKSQVLLLSLQMLVFRSQFFARSARVAPRLSSSVGGGARSWTRFMGSDFYEQWWDIMDVHIYIYYIHVCMYVCVCVCKCKCKCICICIYMHLYMYIYICI
jgi:hypothetical protein